MVNRPSVPEIITVNSEELQTQIRDLLPSQNGFGSELQASNVITPIIDLTRSAEGSGLPTVLQNALSFGSNTNFIAQNATVNLATSPGFYRVVGTTSLDQVGSTIAAGFLINDGVDTKTLWRHSTISTTAVGNVSLLFDLVFWLRAGDTLQAVSNNADALINGSHRQIATGDGTLVQPSGYPL